VCKLIKDLSTTIEPGDDECQAQLSSFSDSSQKTKKLLPCSVVLFDCIESIPEKHPEQLYKWTYETVLESLKLLSSKEPWVQYLDSEQPSVECIWNNCGSWVTVLYSTKDVKFWAKSEEHPCPWLRYRRVNHWVIPSSDIGATTHLLFTLLEGLFHNFDSDKESGNFTKLLEHPLSCSPYELKVASRNDVNRLSLLSFGFGYTFVDELFALLRTNSMASHASWESLIISQLEAIPNFYLLDDVSLSDEIGALPWLRSTFQVMKHPRYSSGEWLVNQIRVIYCTGEPNFPSKTELKNQNLTSGTIFDVPFAYTDNQFWKESVGQTQKILRLVSQISTKTEQTNIQLWYHGTNNAAAYSIAQHINLHSEKSHDFGRSNAFYVGNLCTKAVEWAKLKTVQNQYSAIVVFAIPENMSDLTCYEFLCDKELRSFVSHSRRMTRRSSPNAQNSQLILRIDGNYDFVKGPVCRNPSFLCTAPVCGDCLACDSCVECRTRPSCQTHSCCSAYFDNYCDYQIPEQPVFYDDFLQIAAKSERGATYLQECLCCIILLPPSHHRA
jgi:hypothetical protein